MSRPSRRFSTKTKLLSLLFSLAIAWGIAEATLAALGLPREDLVFINKETEDWDCYCSNPRGYFVERRATDGRTIYCVDHTDDPPRHIDLQAEQYRDSYKILTVGDSFTWGLGVRVRDSYPYLLAGLLTKAAQRPVAISNFAHVGRMITEIREEMRLASANGPADLCIYGYVLNDPLDMTDLRAIPVQPAQKAPGMDNADIDDGINVRTANLERFRMESPLGQLRQYSRTLDLALRVWEWRRIEARTIAYYQDLYDPEKNPQGLAITWSAIAEMRQLQEQSGKRFLVVIFPLFVDVDGDYPFADLHRLVSQQLTAMQVDHLDLLPVYQKHRAQELWVHPLDRHPNEIAHRIAAEAISDYLMSKGWLKRIGVGDRGPGVGEEKNEEGQIASGQ